MGEDGEDWHDEKREKFKMFKIHTEPWRVASLTEASLDGVILYRIS